MAVVQSYNHFPIIADRLHKSLASIVKQTAYDGRRNVRAQIEANGQIDTKLMYNSVYVKGTFGSTYGQGMIGLQEKPGKGIMRVSPKRAQAFLGQQSKLFPEIDAPPNEFTAYFAVAATYGQWQNYGTSRIPARPFWEPGIAQTQQQFDNRLSKIEPMLKGEISLSGAIEDIST